MKRPIFFAIILWWFSFTILIAVCVCFLLCLSMPLDKFGIDSICWIGTLRWRACIVLLWLNSYHTALCFQQFQSPMALCNWSLLLLWVIESHVVTGKATCWPFSCALGIFKFVKSWVIVSSSYTNSCQIDESLY